MPVDDDRRAKLVPNSSTWSVRRYFFPCSGGNHQQEQQQQQQIIATAKQQLKESRTRGMRMHAKRRESNKRNCYSGFPKDPRYTVRTVGLL